MQKSNLVLIGMPAAGKSSAGIVAAKRLGMRFIDTDLVIQEQTGLTLPELIAIHGNDGFLSIENEICAALDAQKTIIATGGSVVYGAEAMRHLKETGKIIYLSIDYNSLCGRLKDLAGRGVAHREGQTLFDLYKERQLLYETYADVTIHQDHTELNLTWLVDQIVSCRTGET
ncbi:MAG: shikimate kinase [Blautia sp.]|nr:shikimate kinase [Blautia sp.]